MIYYGKFFLFAYLLMILQSTILFKGVLNLFIVPDFLLIYIFWLVIENKESIAKYVGLFSGIFLDLLNPDKTFINTISYFFSTLYIINLRNRFITFNFLLKIITVKVISLAVSIPKTIYLYYSSGILTQKDFQMIIFYVLSNGIIMYFVYYFDMFILKRNEV